MCGIAGVISGNQNETMGLVSKMISVLNHRGPDDKRVVGLPGATLGFTRLSIIDLDARSMQPFISNCGRYTLVFNGEIYNYLEIKSELKNNVSFRTKGDAEVLLQAFIVWGKKCVEKLNGMFSFCIYDKIKKEAFLCRDRFGQKPLFYFIDRNRLFFASEIKAFRQAGFDLRSNKISWQKYLQFGIYDDDENTFFADVKQVKPGECLEFKEGTVKKQLYYDIESIAKTSQRFRSNSKNTKEDLYNLLSDSIKIHTRTDVPYSIALSGGFDSSAILSLIKENKINAPSSCFTLDFCNHDKESIWANKAATYFNTQTKVTDVTIENMIQNFSRDLYYQESPLGGLMNIGQTVNFDVIKNNGYTVILDGAGVDEVFCGYKSLHQQYLYDRLESDSIDKLIDAYCKFWKEDKVIVLKILKNRKNKVRTEIDGTFSSNNLFMTNLEKFDKKNSTSLLEMQINYVKYYKLNRGLRMKDRASMQNSTELRVPFIDHRIVEFGLSLEEDCYFKYGRSKSIIREVFKSKMNDAVRIADKRSINAPQGKWLRSPEGQVFVRSIINSDSFKTRGLFDVNKVLSSYNDYCKSPSNNSFFIWQWLNYEIWHRIFIDK